MSALNVNVLNGGKYLLWLNWIIVYHFVFSSSLKPRKQTDTSHLPNAGMIMRNWCCVMMWTKHGFRWNSGCVFLLFIAIVTFYLSDGALSVKFDMKWQAEMFPFPVNVLLLLLILPHQSLSQVINRLFEALSIRTIGGKMVLDCPLFENVLQLTCNILINHKFNIIYCLHHSVSGTALNCSIGHQLDTAASPLEGSGEAAAIFIYGRRYTYLFMTQHTN